MKQALYCAVLLSICSLSAFAQDISVNEQLILASYEGDSTKLQSLIDKGADVNASTYEGVTPLMFASQNGFTGIVSKLIKQGALVNTRATDGKTALILAISFGNIETAEFLIRNGAGVDLADGEGISPLMHAVIVDSFYMPDMLLYYDADIYHSDNKGVDALMLSCMYGSYEIAISLLEAGAEINNAGSDGNTPLHYATSSGHTDLMELLILNGALLEAKNNSGYTPLALAVSMNKYNESVILIGYGADVNTRIRPSMNPLVIAVSNWNDSLERLLLNNDAEILRRPYFNRFTAGSGFSFNRDDSRVDVEFGLSDSRFYWMPSVSYGFRPAPVRVIESRDTSLLFQYWERRHFISVNLSKAFFIRRFKWGLTTGAYAGMGGVLTFGSYKGSSSTPDTRFLFNPEIGCMLEYNPFRLIVGYKWMDLHLKYFNTGWFSISLQFLLNSRKMNLIP